MDLTMPVMDGCKVTSTLKQMMKDGIINSFPIVACSAIIQNPEEVVQAGLDDFCVKPVTTEKILTILEKFGLISDSR